MNYKKLFFWLIFGIIFISIFSIIIPNVKSDIQNSDKFIFKENELYNEKDSDGLTSDIDYNIRERYYYTQNYSATFSFDNDIGKNDTSIGFISNVLSGYVYGLESYDNHYSVINLRTDITDQNIFCNFYFYDLEGNIDFWWQTNNTDVTNGFALYDDNQRCIHCYFASDGNYKYLDGMVLTDTGFPYYANNWTHIRIHWQSDNDFDWYINGRAIVNNGNNYHDLIHGINRIMFYTSVNSEFYIDAFGIDDAVYDGIPYYNVYDNFVPQKIELNEKEIDTFELDFSNDDFRNNDTLLKYREEVENDFSIEHFYDIDNRLRWNALPTGSTYHDYFDIIVNTSCYIFNFSFLMYLREFYNTEQRFLVYIYPYGSIDFYLLIQFSSNGNVYVYDYLDGSADSQLISQYHIYDLAYINFYINYLDNVGNVWCNDSVKYFSVQKGNIGIGKITFAFDKYDVSTHNSILEFLNFGIYNNGSSIVSDINNNYNLSLQQSGYLGYDVIALPLYYQILRYNLWTYDIYVNQCSIYNTPYYENYLEFNYFDLNNYSGSYFYNLIENFSYIYRYLIFSYYNDVINPTYINIEGVYLEIDTYSYDGILIKNDYYITSNYYINTDTENNYFYAKDNKLYYHFNKTNSDKNYMSISFYINNYLIDENYGLAFNSYITNSYTGNIYFYYSDLSNEYFTINKSNSIKYSEYNLTESEGLYLTEIEIIISNDDITDVSGYTNGYLDYLNLGIEYTIINEIPILDDTLLDMTFLEGIVYVVIILIFIIIPCFLVYERYGKKVVIPMLLLMVIVLMVSTFLPIWLSLILLFSGILFLYYSSKRDDSND